ncbi:MAG: D-alanine--D-alanine ligase family protein [Actinomycetaceae bacterium]|nr:D-alanine--D-alanine ligase family protein [Actinomycetaceae bacterium]
MDSSTQSRPTVMVLFGGRSGEHGISCATAAGILRAIDRNRYDVIPVGITPDGKWIRMEDNPALYELKDDGTTYTVSAGNSHMVMPAGLGHALEVELCQADKETTTIQSVSDVGTIDVVFPVLHGAYGEDGTVQGLLEMTDTAYVGCGVLASAACMDKHVTKVLLDYAGLPAGRWRLVTMRRWHHDRQALLEEINELGFPVFVKPCRAGSSLGISKVDTASELETAIVYAQQYDPRVIVEAMLQGMEIECAVLDSPGTTVPRASTPGRIAIDDSVDFYDYDTKYVKTERIDLQIPAPISDELSQRVQDLALRAFEVVEAEGLARIDFFVDEQTDSVVINEINTMPGFTPYSMYPALWAHDGVDYPSLVGELIELALQRPKGLR